MHQQISSCPDRRDSAGNFSLATDARDGHPRRLWLLAIAILTAAVVLGAPSVSRAADAFSSCPAGANQIACENALPGDPETDWQIDGTGDPSIQGFATQMSVNVGRPIQFKINTPSTNYHIDILRLGLLRWRRRPQDRGGDASRRRRLPRPSRPVRPTPPHTGLDRLRQLVGVGLLDGAERRGVRSSTSRTWSATTTAGGDSQIPFVVRNDASHSAIVVPDLRRDLGGLQRPTAATASTRARWPARRATRWPTRPPTRSPTTGRSTHLTR